MITSKLKFIFLLFFVATPTFATPMYYTFEGTVDGFSTLNFNSAPSASDFGLNLGSTSIYHVFEIDFDKEGFYTANQSNIMTVSNSIYVDLLTQEFLNDNYGNNTFNHGLNIDLAGGNNDKSEIAGGSLTLIGSESINTPNWRIQDWAVGQVFSFAEQTASSSNERIYLNGEVTLTSISNLNPMTVPESTPFVLLVIGLIGLYLQQPKTRRDTKD